VTKPNRPERHDDGVVILYVAVFLLVSLWFVSLAIDVGKVMAARTELQAAADAAALAGASAIDPLTGDVIPDEARTRAASTAASNRAYEGIQTPVTIDPAADVDFPAPNQVRVRVHRTEATGNAVLLHFAQTLGLPRIDVTADATAEAEILDEVCERLAPFAPQDPPDGIGFFTDCDSVYYLKVGAQNSSSGNFQLLDLPECNEDEFSGGGGAAIREYTLNGYGCCVGIGDEFVLTEPGNKVGPLRDALIERWDRDTDQTSHCHQDYTGNGSRIFVTPIIQTFDVNGKKLVKIVNFAAFFMSERPQGSMSQQGVPGQFIKYIAPGNAGNNPPTNTGIYGIHLVE